MPNLTEVYENLYKRRHLGEAVLDVQFDDEPEKKTFRLTDVYARKVLGYAGRLKFDFEDKIEDWVKAAKWGTQARQFLVPAIMVALSESYNIDDIEIVQKIIKGIDALTKEKKTLNTLQKLLTQTSNNFLDFFKDTIKQTPPAAIFNNYKFIDMVIKFEFSEAKVAVGPGEVFMTLFSEAENPKTGDIIIPQTEQTIELKADGGRPGKRDVVHAAVNAFKEINKQTSSIMPRYTEDILNELFVMVEPFRGKLNKATPNFNEIISLLLDKKKPQILKWRFLSQQARLKELAAQGERYYKDIMNDIDLPFTIFEKLGQLGQLKEGGEATSFKTYFNIIDDMSGIMTLAKFSPKSKDVENIIAQYYSTLDPSQIVAALQINDYQHEEGFDYICYFNQTKKTILSFGPFSENYQQNLEMVLQKADQLKVAVNTGGGRGGCNVFI